MFSRKSINTLESGGHHHQKYNCHLIVVIAITIRSEIAPRDEDGMLMNPSDILWDQVILELAYNYMMTDS